MRVVRELQERTGGITEFVPLSFIPFQTLLGRTHGVEEISREENLKHTAVFRLALGRTVASVQASWVKMGLDAATESLRWGVNDLGGTLMEESISRLAGSYHGTRLRPRAAGRRGARGRAPGGRAHDAVRDPPALSAGRGAGERRRGTARRGRSRVESPLQAHESSTWGDGSRKSNFAVSVSARAVGRRRAVERSGLRLGRLDLVERHRLRQTRQRPRTRARRRSRRPAPAPASSAAATSAATTTTSSGSSAATSGTVAPGTELALGSAANGALPAGFGRQNQSSPTQIQAARHRPDARKGQAQRLQRDQAQLHRESLDAGTTPRSRSRNVSEGICGQRRLLRRRRQSRASRSRAWTELGRNRNEQ